MRLMMARKRKTRRRKLQAAGIIPERGAKPRSGAQLRAQYRHSRPTNELIRHKARALGIEAFDKDGNPAFNWNSSVEPLDVMLQKGALTEQQYAAAMRIGYLRFMEIGRGGPTLMNWQMQADTVSSDHAPDRALTDDEKLEAAERAHTLWLEAVEALRVGHGSLVLNTLTTLIDGRWPPSNRIAHVMRALDTLVKLWRIT